MKCKYFSEDHETCVNDSCPYLSDFCPVYSHQEVCRYAKDDYDAFYHVDLSGKCGSCVFGTPVRFSTKGRLSYVQCGCIEKNNRTEYSGIKQRTAKACKYYKQKEGS